jgi:hypothetical protein
MKYKKLLHPLVPNWEGDRGWAAEGEEPSGLVSFDTEGDLEPTKISHNRDVIYIDGQLEQDYNFIDYFFGFGENQVSARFYLDEVEVKIGFPEGAKMYSSAKAAGEHLDPKILLYFQKRFRSIAIITSNGYKTLWKRKVR